MQPTQELCPILYKRMLREDVVDLVVYAKSIAAQARPGQFVQIKCGESALLRRPISICSVDGSALRLVIESAGLGTEWLCRRAAGEQLDLIGPLGSRGFPAPDPSKGPILLVGGGCGNAPLLFAASQSEAVVDVLMGFSTASKVMMTDDFARFCRKVTVSTDDGSYGIRGYANEVAKEMLLTESYAALYACGNMEMLKAVADTVSDLGIPCYVSLDERMGCGLGFCYTCAASTRKEDGSHFYSHVCVYGPVYELSEVVWA